MAHAKTGSDTRVKDCLAIQTEDVDSVWIFPHDLHAVDAFVEVGDFEGLVVMFFDTMRLETVTTVAAEIAVHAVKESGK